MKKRLTILLAVALLLSVSPVCLAAGVNFDTLADWNIRIAVPEGKTAVLEEDEYYIFAMHENSIPYVMLRPYSYNDAEAFLSDFTEYMKQHYRDLTVTSPAAWKTIGEKECCEIDYGYTVQGYDVRDRRIAITRDGTTYMFCSKEIPELDMIVGSMLEDVVADCEFLSDTGDDLPEGLDFMTVTGLAEMKKALDGGASITSVYYTDGYGFSVSEFTTADPEEMGALWNALTKIRLVGPVNMSITDWYPMIAFSLDDGSRYGARFEGTWLSAGRENYEIAGAEDFWNLTAALVEKYMEQTATDTDFLDAYAPVLEPYRAFLAGTEPDSSDSTERGDYYLVLGDTGISFMCINGEKLGFCLRDLDGNGIPELLIGAIGSQYYDDALIYDLFTLDNGTPVRVLASSDRVRYYLCEDNRILNEGSGGAAYNVSAFYRLNGSGLELTEGIVMADAECYEIFGDRGSVFSDRNPEDRRITKDEFFKILEEQESMFVPLELEPLE